MRYVVIILSVILTALVAGFFAAYARSNKNRGFPKSRHGKFSMSKEKKW